MKLTSDKEADALYLDLDETPAVESEEISPGVILDYNSEGKVTGIEPKSAVADEIGRLGDQLIPKSAVADEIGRRGDQMLYLSKRVPSSQLGRVEVEPQALLAAS